LIIIIILLIYWYLNCDNPIIFYFFHPLQLNVLVTS